MCLSLMKPFTIKLPSSPEMDQFVFTAMKKDISIFYVAVFSTVYVVM